MAEYDPRILRVGVQIGNYINWYKDIAISAEGSKSTSERQAECTVTLTNLTKDVRDYLLSATSPFNKKKDKKCLIVEAGRESIGSRKIFEGDITEATISQPPDIELTLKALANNSSKGKLVANTQPAQSKLSEIAKKVADDLGLSLNFQAQDKNIKSYSFTGSALKQVNKLSEAGSVNAYIDGEFLIVKDLNQPLKGRRRILNKDNGMVGIPETTEKGIRVMFLLDTTTELGSDLRIESYLNPSVNGSYTVYKLSFSISNRDLPFYWVAEATRND